MGNSEQLEMMPAASTRASMRRIRQGDAANVIGNRLGKDNALNLIRLVLAVLVIVSHAFPIGGFGPDPALGGLGLGSFAVGGFLPSAAT